MKNFFFVILLWSGFACTQTFFINPSVSKKYITSSLSSPPPFSYGNFFPVSTSFNNPYVNVKNQLLSSRPTILLGIRLGYEIDKRRRIQIGIEMDETGSMIKIAKSSKNNWGITPPSGMENIYNVSTGYASASHALKKLSFDFQSYFQGQNTLFKNSFYSVGLISLFSPEHIFTFSNSYNTILLNNAVIDSATTYSIYRGNTNLGFKLGLGTDVNWKSKSKSNYLFTLEIEYNQGLRDISNTTFEYSINDNGEKFKLRFYAFSRGSGVFVRISRRIQFYPWRPNRKPKEIVG